MGLFEVGLFCWGIANLVLSEHRVGYIGNVYYNQIINCSMLHYIRTLAYLYINTNALSERTDSW